METSDRDYIGTDLKFIIDVRASGFDKTVDEFEVIVSRGSGKEQKFTKDELAQDDEGNYYLCFSTEDFGTGLYMLTVIAHVPDDDFEDGFREEVTQMELVNIKKLRK